MAGEYSYLIGRRVCFSEDIDETRLRDLLQKIRDLFLVTSVVICDTCLYIIDDQIEVLIEKANSSSLLLKLGVRKDFYNEKKDLKSLCGEKYHNVVDQIESFKLSGTMSVEVISLKTMSMGTDHFRFHDLKKLKAFYSQGDDTVHSTDLSSEEDKMLDDSLELLLTKQEQEVFFKNYLNVSKILILYSDRYDMVKDYILHLNSS